MFLEKNVVTIRNNPQDFMFSFSSLRYFVFIQSWWVIVFCLFCIMAYEQKLHEIQINRMQLNNEMEQLKKSKKELLYLQKNLSLTLENQKKEEWIELTLMKKLGVIPKETRKILFQKEDKDK